MSVIDILNTTDRFAATNGIQLVEISEGRAVAEMTVEEKHLNGGNVCQGGAIFTLADLAFAAVSNNRGLLTLGISNSIEFLHSAKLGDRLTAEAIEICDHPKLPYCEIKVWNQDHTLIATVTGRAYRTRNPFPPQQT